MSGRDLAKAIGRGETYVRDRINDDKEWALGDIERMCKLWSLTPGQLIDCNSIPNAGERSSSVPSAADSPVSVPLEAGVDGLVDHVVSSSAGASTPDFYAMAAKRGDIEGEQRRFEEMP